MKINQMRQSLHKPRNMKKVLLMWFKKSYMLNICQIIDTIPTYQWFYSTGSVSSHNQKKGYIRDTIPTYHWFDSTGSVHSHSQQESEKGDEQKVNSDAYVSVYGTKTSGWVGLQISFHGRKQVTNTGHI